MVHISKISKERIDRVEDVLTLGDVVKAKCMGKDKMGRVSFSIKDANRDMQKEQRKEAQKETTEEVE